MDYETKILLNNLIDEVGRLNDPDWWVIGITIVNALIMAWLGWRQYKLQQRQVRQQEYGVYRQLYVVLENVESLSGHLLNRIYEYFSLPLYGKNFLEHLLEQINLCDKQLNQSSIDFRLWISYNEIDVLYYNEMVYSMRLLVQFLQRMEDEKVMVHIDDYSNRAAMNTTYGDYVQIIIEILKRVKDDSYKKALETELNTYVKTRNYLVNRKYLEKIENYCKVI